MDYTERLIREAWSDAGGGNATPEQIWEMVRRKHVIYQARKLISYRRATLDSLTVRQGTISTELARMGLSYTPSGLEYRGDLVINPRTGEVRSLFNEQDV